MEIFPTHTHSFFFMIATEMTNTCTDFSLWWKNKMALLSVYYFMISMIITDRKKLICNTMKINSNTNVPQTMFCVTYSNMLSGIDGYLEMDYMNL